MAKATTTALAWGIFWALAIALVWWAACGPEVSRGEAWYDSGDTLSVHMAALDSSGAVFLPDSTRIIFVRNGTRKDSIGYGSLETAWTGGTTMTAKGGAWISGIFVIPSSWNPPYDLVLEGRFWGDGYTEDVALVEPRRVRVLDTVPYVTELVEQFNDSIAYVTVAGTAVELTEAFPTTMAVTGGYVDSVGVAVLLREDWPTSIDSVGFVTTTQTAVELTEAFPTTMAAAGGWIDSSLVTVTARTLDEAFPTSMTTTGGYLDSVGVAVILREDWPTTIDTVSYVTELIEEITVSSIDSVRAVGYVDSVYQVADLIETITIGNVDSVRAIGYVDSFSVNALGDLWSGIATGTAAIVDTNDCTACGVYAGDGVTGITGAPVYITTTSAFTSMSDVVGFTWSVDGYWNVRIPRVPGVTNTFYVWAYYQNRYQPSGKTITVAP